MNVTETRKAIMAMAHMTCSRVDGEWRVAPTVAALLAIFPHRTRKWAEGKQERAAHYTTDNEDALLTAAATHGWCVVMLRKAEGVKS